ncbi:hypothetical protein [Parafrankia sp. FMc2]|uniref:hypothetical protein n=1 Tax=Parafrankia sp. FMc2 TaxID=3233196 RepID=UPI0034D56D8C
MTVRLWLDIYPPEAGAGFQFNRVAMRWHYDMDTLHTPRTGDEIRLDGDVYNTVRRVRWHLDGVVHAELTPFQIDPVEAARPLIDGRNRRAWDSRKGSLDEILERTRWTRGYGP